MAPPDDDAIVNIIPGSPPRADPDPLSIETQKRFRLQCGIPFEVRFHDESPDEDDPRRERHSRPRDGHHEVRMRARQRKGQYDYTIVIDGEDSDPAIIIR